MNRVLAILLVLLAAPSSASGQPTSSPPPPGAPSSPTEGNGPAMLALIRSTLLAVHHGNQTGNYTVLRDLGAPGFQSANSAARLGEIFATLRTRNIDLLGVAILEPQLTVGPAVRADGMLRAAGWYPAGAERLNFDLLMTPVEGRWRLFGIALNLSSPANAGSPQKPEDAAPARSAEPAPPAVQPAPKPTPAPAPVRPPPRSPPAPAPAPAPAPR